MLPQVFGFNDDALDVNITNLNSIDYSSWGKFIVTGGYIQYQDSDSRVPNQTLRYCKSLDCSAMDVVQGDNSEHKKGLL